MSDVDPAARRRRSVRWHYRRRVLRHPLRWWRERCAHCGRRRFPDESMILMPGSGGFHDVCHSYVHWRRVAAERLAVLDVVTDVWDVNPATVREVMETREGDGPGNPRTLHGSNAWNVAWRVFYDLDGWRKRKAAV